MELPSRRRDRGATLVEYALILALVVVGAVASIQFLTNQSEAEVANQADCVSTRPPPPSCQARAVTTSTTAVPPETTTTLAPETTTTTEATTTTTTTPSTTTPSSSTTSTTLGPVEVGLSLRPEAEGCWYFGCDTWTVDATVTATRSGAPVSGAAVVRYRTLNWAWTGSTWSDWSSVSCTVGGSGTCTRTIPPGGDWDWWVTAAEVEVISFDGAPVTGAGTRVDRPW